MNAISKAVNDLYFKIPREILKEAFTSKDYHWRDLPVSMDEQITSQVIRDRVLVDCNLVGGTEAVISLDGIRGEMIDTYMSVYRIPKDRTEGRTINSVLSVGYGNMMTQAAAGNFQACSISPVLQAGSSMMSAMSPTPMVSTARVQLIGENTILIRDTSPTGASAYVRCILANDEMLSNIQMRSIPSFCTLVEFAVKSFIYNSLIVRIDSAQLSGGQALGRFKDIVESYADSETMYQDYLKNKWMKIALMNDEMSSTRLLKMMIGGMH